jgi:hypothetical protein
MKTSSFECNRLASSCSVAESGGIEASEGESSNERLLCLARGGKEVADNDSPQYIALGPYLADVCTRRGGLQRPCRAHPAHAFASFEDTGDTLEPGESAALVAAPEGEPLARAPFRAVLGRTVPRRALRALAKPTFLLFLKGGHWCALLPQCGW